MEVEGEEEGKKWGRGGKREVKRQKGNAREGKKMDLREGKAGLFYWENKIKKRLY